MNAEELAQALDNSIIGGGVGNIAAQAAEMLRKQDRDIKNLEDQFEVAIGFIEKANELMRRR